ncbi:MAG: hypothetical protein WAN05_16420 [Roseiarcus sp.]
MDAETVWSASAASRGEGPLSALQGKLLRSMSLPRSGRRAAGPGHRLDPAREIS